MKKMKTIIQQARKDAAGKKFIEKYEGELVFNYYAFTHHCTDLCNDTNDPNAGCFLRDIVMEDINPKFNREKPYKFRNFNCID